MYKRQPQEILDFYKMYRPSPLVRAYCLEKALGTPAKIYYKFEGNNTSGSHKLNSAIAQAYYAKQQGLKGVTTETGAGQWGTALSMACAYLGLDCKVYMVKVSYEQKPFRREVMRTYGASVTPSPSETTAIGRKILQEHPGTTGSLGCAISEAVEVAKMCIRDRAFVMLKPGVPANEETKDVLMTYIRKNVAKYALPYDIEFRSELPKTLVGKVAYRVLEDEEKARIAAQAAQPEA